MRPIRPLLLVVPLAACASSGGSERDGGEPAPASDAPSGRVVTAEDIERNPSQSIEELLATHFPGVVITSAPGGGIRIRCRMSFRASDEPLYVIDGVPVQSGPNGALFGINVYDIESIEVLTDPANTTMYGVRGANGVVVVTTKIPPRPDP